MRRERDYFIVPFFMNGELQDLQVYENESDAYDDVGSWCNGTGRAHEVAGEAPFRGTGLYYTRLGRAPRWHVLTVRRGALEDTIIEWLREDPKYVWSNVLATVTSSSLTEVYEALLRARDARQIAIIDTVATGLGPVCQVRLPRIDDRIIWALSESPEAWSDEIAQTTGDALTEVNSEIQELQKIEAVEVFEVRQAAAGPSLHVRLHPTERRRRENLE